MLIHATAPVRIDLAGGTLDISPLHLLLDEPALTVNVAVALPARVLLHLPDGGEEPAGRRAVSILSRDRRRSLCGPTLESLGKEKELALPLRIARHYSPPFPFRLESDCQAPAGSGLGGSSALAVALCAAFEAAALADRGALRGRLALGAAARARLVETARDLETSVLGKPTGVQDYHPAAYGGLAAIHCEVGGTRREPLPFDIRLLEEQLVLCFSGRSRFSGANNWEVFKSVIEGRVGPRRQLEGIARAAAAMREALLAGDLERAGRAMAEEWKSRARLAPGVNTPRLARLLSCGRKAGAAGGKACGAGGGGCLAFLCREGRRAAVERALRNEGARILQCTVDRQGVRVQAETAHQPELLTPETGDADTMIREVLA